jgi:hypothetical protein
MSTYNLSQTAAEIDSAIGKVHNADTSPTQGSTSMVTSGGVYTAVNNIGVSALPITTEAQGIANYDNDSNIPTNAAVKAYVDSNSQTLNTGWVTLGTSSASGTATSDGFIVAQAESNTTTDDALVTVTVAGQAFRSEVDRYHYTTITIPIAKGESYSVSTDDTRNESIRFKGFS